MYSSQPSYIPEFYNIIQEEQFAQEFLNHDGLNQLVDVIFKSTGNTLAVRIVVFLPSNPNQQTIVRPYGNAESYGARIRLGQTGR